MSSKRKFSCYSSLSRQAPGTDLTVVAASWGSVVSPQSPPFFFSGRSPGGLSRHLRWKGEPGTGKMGKCSVEIEGSIQNEFGGGKCVVSCMFWSLKVMQPRLCWGYRRGSWGGGT